MKKVFGILSKKSVVLLMLSVCMALFGVTDVSSMTAMAGAVEGMNGAGVHITGDAPLATQVILDNSPDLILLDIDDRVTKISPYKNQIDQVGRLAARNATAARKAATSPFSSRLTDAAARTKMPRRAEDVVVGPGCLHASGPTTARGSACSGAWSVHHPSHTT